MILPDRALIRKYSQPGPRYTSYPTAPQFSDAWEDKLLLNEAAEETGDLSLYFHIPFCRSLCWFCGCTKIISTDQDRADHYLDLLEKEITQFRARVKPGRKVRQMHFGGGTPNYLSPQQIRRFSTFLHEQFEFYDDAELSTELDPRTLTEEQVEAFREMGINRASIGVQDIKPEVQIAIHRVQTDEQNRQSLKWLRQAGIRSINLDLIYGLPMQTPESFEETLHHILDYSPDRLAVFSYALSPAQKILEAKTLPDAESKISMLEKIIRILPDNGYHYIGMDHFAKQTDPLTIAQKNGSLQRNFQGYSTHSGVEICAFGMSSISQTRRSYRQNSKELTDYAQAVSAGLPPIARGILLSSEDVIRRDVIMTVMCRLGLDFEELTQRHGIPFAEHFADSLHSLQGMQQDGLLEMDETHLKVTEPGRLFIRNIAMAFDAYLARKETKYSNTV